MIVPAIDFIYRCLVFRRIFPVAVVHVYLRLTKTSQIVIKNPVFEICSSEGTCYDAFISSYARNSIIQDVKRGRHVGEKIDISLTLNEQYNLCPVRRCHIWQHAQRRGNLWENAFSLLDDNLCLDPCQISDATNWDKASKTWHMRRK